MTVSVLRYGLCCLIVALGLQGLAANAAQPSETQPSETQPAVTQPSKTQPAETLLPTTTKGFLSVPDLNVLRARWDQTQLGQLMVDEKMQPFVKDLKRQMSAKMNRADTQLGLTWSDLQSVAGGDVCLAVAQPWDTEKEDASDCSLCGEGCGSGPE